MDDSLAVILVLGLFIPLIVIPIFAMTKFAPFNPFSLPIFLAICILLLVSMIVIAREH